MVYAGLTLVSAAFSPQPRTSLIDCKQLVLFLLVPITYRLMNQSRAQTLASVVMSLGAASAAVGIFSSASCTSTGSAGGRRARSAIT